MRERTAANTSVIVVEVLVEEPLRVRAVTGREHAVARLVDDTEVAGVDEFVPQPLDEESLDVLQGLPGTDDDGQPVLVQLVEPVEDVAGIRCPSGQRSAASRRRRDEGVDRSFVLSVARSRAVNAWSRLSAPRGRRTRLPPSSNPSRISAFRRSSSSSVASSQWSSATRESTGGNRSTKSW